MIEKCDLELFDDFIARMESALRVPDIKEARITSVAIKGDDLRRLIDLAKLDNPKNEEITRWIPGHGDLTLKKYQWNQLKLFLMQVDTA